MFAPRRTSGHRRFHVVTLAAFVAAACGDGCGGCSETPYSFPLDDPTRPDAVVQNEVARVRVTQDFVDFVASHLPDLLRDSLAGTGAGYVDGNDVLHIDIPDISAIDLGILEFTFNDAEALLWLEDFAQRMEVNFEAPNRVRISASGLRLGIQGDVRGEAAVLGITSDSSCPVVGDLGAGHAAEISISAVIAAGAGDAPDHAIEIEQQIQNIELVDLDIRVTNNYCQTEPECQDGFIAPCAECEAFCGAVVPIITTVANSLVSAIGPLINQILAPVVENLLNDLLGDLSDQGAQIETQLSLAELTGLPALNRADPFGILFGAEPGPFDVIDRGTGLGMEITARGGAEATLSDCVEAGDAFLGSKGPPPVLGGTDDQGRPYHIGLTVASSIINQILFAAHRSGSICLKIGTADFDGLTGGSFALNAGVLGFIASDLLLLADPAAPIILELKPRRAPIVDFGSGELIGEDANGGDLYDWLLKLNVDDLGLAIHTLVEDRYVRIGEVTFDANIGLNIATTPDNSLELAVGELRFDDYQEVYNELLTNTDFSEVLPTVIDLALGQIVGGNLNFTIDLEEQVGNALGIPVGIRVNEIKRDGIQEDYLTLTLTMTASQSANLGIRAPTIARLGDDNQLVRETEAGARPSGRIRLKVGEGLADEMQGALEYQVRVDGGLWRIARTPEADGSLTVNDGHLILPGLHTVEVRARFKDDYRTLDPTPERLSALVDPSAPSLAAQRQPDGIRVTLRDLYSPVDRLGVNVQRGGHTEQLTMNIDEDRQMLVGFIPETSFVGADHVTLTAFDGANNTTELVVHTKSGLTVSAQDDAPFGCHAAPGQAHHHLEWLMALMAFAGIYLLRRRPSL